MATRKVRVIITKVGLDGHDRGAKVIASLLREAGMEVIYLGMFQTAENIVSAAVQEDADVIGISTYCGGELPLSSDLLKAAEEKGIKDSTVFLLGGIFPPKDIPKLEKMGFSGTFLSASQEDIVSCIEKSLATKR